MRIDFKIKFLFVLLMIVITPQIYADEIKPASNLSYENLVAKMGVLKQQLQEVRRDQLNYQIERDLLKETYSSNLQTVNVVITIVLGTFTILGFLGVRSIGLTRQEFRDELDQLREIRTRSEVRLAEIEAQQKLAQNQLDDVSKLNIEQEQRLKLLEIQEQASSSVSQSQYQRALDYISVGLELDPDDITLLQLKWNSLVRLKRFDEVRVVLEKLIEIDPLNDGAAKDLCEMYLLLGLRQEYSALSSTYSSAIQALPHLAWFFQAVILYQDSEELPLRDHIKLLAESLSPEKKSYSTWSYDEIRSTIESDEATPSKKLLLRTFEVLDGSSGPEEIIALLEENKNK